MSQILDIVASYFDKNGWPYSRQDDSPVLATRHRGVNGEWPCYAWASEERGQFAFFSKCPVTAPPDKRATVAEFVARANYDLILGNFELDFTDGEIRFKTSIGVLHDRLTNALVDQMIFANIIMMDRYLPALMKVISSDISPEEALAEVESR